MFNRNSMRDAHDQHRDQNKLEMVATYPQVLSSVLELF